MKGLLISDVHSGSYFAPVHPDFTYEDDIYDMEMTLNLNKLQEKLFEHWTKMTKGKHYDFVIVNGDVTDGANYKERGKYCWSTDPKHQIENARLLLSMIDTEQFYFTKGSNYHVNEGQISDELVSKEMDGKYSPTLNLYLKDERYRIHAQHYVNSSKSTWQYLTTPLARDMVLMHLNSSAKRYGDVNLVLRSHTHFFTGVFYSHQIGIVTPCWKAKDMFAIDHGLITPPDIGYVTVNIEDGQMWPEWDLISPVKPIKEFSQ